MNVPQLRTTVLRLVPLLESIEMLHEHIVVEYVKQLPAMELDRINKEKRMVCSGQRRLNPNRSCTPPIPPKVIGRSVAMEVSLGEGIAKHFVVDES